MYLYGGIFMKYDYHMIVIGAGSGGLVAASGAATLGAKVALIEKEKMGGDCLNTGCVPSKTLLKSAHLADMIKNHQEYGLGAELASVNLEAVMDRVQKIIKAIEPHDSIERYQELGVDVILGEAKLFDSNTVLVNDKKITAKTIVIATGSKASVPKIEGLEKSYYYTNEDIFTLKKLPNHLIVFGSGPIGLELGQAFRHLGSTVTIIGRNKQIFPKDDHDVGPLMEGIFQKEEINLFTGAKTISVKKENEQYQVEIEHQGITKIITGDTLLVSTGRTPSTKNLGLEDVGIKIDSKGYIVTDDYLRTNISNIYACGDVVGPYQFTHIASYQAGLILRNAFFPFKAKLDYSSVPWTTYTKPEVAHVGYTQKGAEEAGIESKVVKVDIYSNDRAKTDNDNEGFLKLVLNKRGCIIGSTIVSEKAGDLIPLSTLAIKQKLKPSVFMDMIIAYPSEAEIYKTAALEISKENYTPFLKKVVKKLFIK